MKLRMLALRLLKRITEEPEVSVEVIASIYASDEGKGHGASVDSPCSSQVALTIARYLTLTDPDIHTKIYLQGVCEDAPEASREGIK